MRGGGYHGAGHVLTEFLLQRLAPGHELQCKAIVDHRAAALGQCHADRCWGHSPRASPGGGMRKSGLHAPPIDRGDQLTLTQRLDEPRKPRAISSIDI